MFERFPKAKLLLGHMGAGRPRGAFGGDAKLKPAEVIRCNVAITTARMLSDEPLTGALQGMGEDAVMFSVDHPFESMTAAGGWFDQAPVSAEVREKISWRNTARILKL